MALAEVPGLLGVGGQVSAGPSGVELREVGDRVRLELSISAVPVLGAVQLGLPGVDEAAVVQVSQLGTSGFTRCYGHLEQSQKPLLKSRIVVAVDRDTHGRLARLLAHRPAPRPLPETLHDAVQRHGVVLLRLLGGREGICCHADAFRPGRAPLLSGDFHAAQQFGSERGVTRARLVRLAHGVTGLEGPADQRPRFVLPVCPWRH